MFICGVIYVYLNCSYMVNFLLSYTKTLRSPLVTISWRWVSAILQPNKLDLKFTTSVLKQLVSQLM
jgi:Sec-independent protein secretion pathway component TatC